MISGWTSSSDESSNNGIFSVEGIYWGLRLLGVEHDRKQHHCPAFWTCSRRKVPVTTSEHLIVGLIDSIRAAAPIRRSDGGQGNTQREKRSFFIIVPVLQLTTLGDRDNRVSAGL
jgi:hypothetical protein